MFVFLVYIFYLVFFEASFFLFCFVFQSKKDFVSHPTFAFSAVHSTSSHEAPVYMVSRATGLCMFRRELIFDQVSSIQSANEYLQFYTDYSGICIRWHQYHAG